MRRRIRREDGTLAYAVLLGVFVSAQYWRLSGLAPVDGLSEHLSNFALSGLAVTLFAGPRAFVDVRLRHRALAAGAVMVAANVVVEVLINAVGLGPTVTGVLGERFNVSDPVDAAAGGGAVALVLAVLPRRQRSAAGPRRAGDQNADGRGQHLRRPRCWAAPARGESDRRSGAS